MAPDLRAGPEAVSSMFSTLVLGETIVIPHERTKLSLGAIYSHGRQRELLEMQAHFYDIYLFI